ncbi:P44/Msp2 family outer membrane protein [Anaplasma ovis]|uniref:P44/Msp2 family outer membrane protein n=1 Tax=Anaplasma ovis TaxID=142058 RepID=UPI000947318A|nr:P44/Msp2 family outer membrane protein [Anaplasma ovis]
MPNFTGTQCGTILQHTRPWAHSGTSSSNPVPHTLTALEGSIGYSIGGARVEVEVGYERFVIKGGKKSNEDTASVFLLGKELAYDTARGQVDRLANALGKMTKSEAKKWGTAVEGATGGDALSRKVCGTANSGSGTNKCGTADSQSTNGKLSTAFNADADATLLSAAGDTISTSGMAISGNTSNCKVTVAIVTAVFSNYWCT